MPMDYGSYLLSASPPGFDIHYNNYVMLQEELDYHGFSKARQSTDQPSPFTARVDELNQTFADIAISSEQDETENCDENENYTESRLERNNNRINDCDPLKKKKKNVSFADENGLNLSQVRIFTESPNSPPRLRKSFLASLTKGATPSVNVTPPLVLKFAQPASNYVLFRDKIEKQNVSLENVILKDYNVLGTLKVKNVAFEKTVRVRFTYDGWENFTDVIAKHVPSPQSGSLPFDTFSFEINVPPTFDPQKGVQFVICYEVESGEFWDNNNGENYTIASADWSDDTISKDETDNPIVFKLDNEERNWTEFSSWNHSNKEIPYY